MKREIHQREREREADKKKVRKLKAIIFETLSSHSSLLSHTLRFLSIRLIESNINIIFDYLVRAFRLQILHTMVSAFSFLITFAHAFAFRVFDNSNRNTLKSLTLIQSYDPSIS